jgi:hypothetical protein
LTVPLAIRRLRGIIDFQDEEPAPHTGVSSTKEYDESGKLGSLKRQWIFAGNDQYRGAFGAFASLAVICGGKSRVRRDSMHPQEMRAHEASSGG